MSQAHKRKLVTIPCSPASISNPCGTHRSWSAACPKYRDCPRFNIISVATNATTSKNTVGRYILTTIQCSCDMHEPRW